mmetsp:Transcript_3479/g.5912  ORF Transcript_3479/g.5912 Transcript_3479/m.5912 type:complete len:321 (-) Transcript_3479:489-1451(-)
MSCAATAAAVAAAVAPMAGPVVLFREEWAEPERFISRRPCASGPGWEVLVKWKGLGHEFDSWEVEGEGVLAEPEYLHLHLAFWRTVRDASSSYLAAAAASAVEALACGPGDWGSSGNGGGDIEDEEEKEDKEDKEDTEDKEDKEDEEDKDKEDRKEKGREDKAEKIEVEENPRSPGNNVTETASQEGDEARTEQKIKGQTKRRESDFAVDDWVPLIREASKAEVESSVWTSFPSPSPPLSGSNTRESRASTVSFATPLSLSMSASVSTSRANNNCSSSSSSSSMNRLLLIVFGSTISKGLSHVASLFIRPSPLLFLFALN